MQEQKRHRKAYKLKTFDKPFTNPAFKSFQRLHKAFKMSATAIQSVPDAMSKLDPLRIARHPSDFLATAPNNLAASNKPAGGENVQKVKVCRTSPSKQYNLYAHPARSLSIDIRRARLHCGRQWGNHGGLTMFWPQLYGLTRCVNPADNFGLALLRLQR